MNKITALRTKILSWYSLLMLVLGLSIITAIFFGVRSFFEKQALTTINTILDHHIVELETLFTSVEEASINIASNPQVKSLIKNGNRDAILPILNEYQRGNRYLAIFILDPQGNTLVSTDNRMYSNNYNFRQYHQDALEQGQGAEIAMGISTQELGYFFARKIEDNGTTLGIAVFKVNVDYINNILLHTIHAHDIREPLSASLMLTDKHGIVIGSTKKERVLKSLAPLDEKDLGEIQRKRTYPSLDIASLTYAEIYRDIKTITTEHSIYKFYDAQDKEQETLSIAKLENRPLFLMAEIEDEKFLEVTLLFTGTMAGALIAITIFVAILMSFILSKILEPLKILQNTAEKIIKNTDLIEPINISSKDEFEDLGKAFNSAVKKLVEVNKSLDKKVKERTTELEAALKAVQREQKEAEIRALELQKFKMAVESTSEHIVITDINGTILYANAGVRKITGYDPQEIIGKKAGSKELWGGLMSQDFYASLWKTIKVEKKPFSGEIQNKRKNGETYIAQGTISPILNNRNEVIFFIGVERDITKVKEVDRMKTEFISLASHQLRTPLSAMKWFLEMLKEGDAGPLNKEQASFVNNIDESNERMIALVNSLLNVSRLESGRIIVEPKPTNLETLVGDLIKELQPKIQEKKMTLKFNPEPNLGEINIDPKLIRNVYMNLLTNSIKYTPEKGEINIALAKNKDAIVSIISDNGYGIPENEKEKVFNKFYRGENIIKVETDGNGLGLYLVKQIIDSSKGKIWFESTVNKGTTFWFSLPLKGMEAKEGEVRLS